MGTSATSPMVLASASPRRRDLLTQAGYSFEVVVPGVDESVFPVPEEGPTRYAEILALAKAQSVAARFPDRLVLGADTIADLEGEIIGKPADETDAERITRRLFSRPHRVITGLALVRLVDDLEIVRSDVTTVYPRALTEEGIARHLEGGSWEGKAGAYAIQETGDEFIERLEGSLTNVMGLPMELLTRLLADIPNCFPPSCDR